MLMFTVAPCKLDCVKKWGQGGVCGGVYVMVGGWGVMGGVYVMVGGWGVVGGVLVMVGGWGVLGVVGVGGVQDGVMGWVMVADGGVLVFWMPCSMLLICFCCEVDATE